VLLKLNSTFVSEFTVRMKNIALLNNRNFKNVYLPVILIVVNFIIKFAFLTQTSIAGDEPFSIYHAQMDVKSIIQLLSQGNNPPLFETLLHFWIGIFGISPMAVRFLPLLFSTAAVYFIYKIGLKFFNFKVAIAAATLYSFSSLHTGLAHETRVYSLLTLLTCVSMYLYFILIHRSDNIRKNWKLILGLSVVNVLVVYAHYFGFFLLFVQTLSLFLIKSDAKKDIVRNYISASFVTFILYLPNIWVLLLRFFDSASNGTWLYPPNNFSNILDVMRHFLNEEYGATFLVKPVVSIIAILIIILFIINIIRKRVSLQNETRVVFVWFFFPYLFMFFVSYYIPMYKERYLIVTSIGLYFLVAMAITTIKPIKYQIVIALLFFLPYLASFRPNYDNKREAQKVIAKAKELQDNSTLIYFCPDWFDINFVYYYDIECFKNYNTTKIKQNMYTCMHAQNVYPISSANEIDTTLLRSFKRIIYIDAGADFSYPGNNVYQFLSNRFTLQQKSEYPEIFKVYTFSR
jgi:hypothetical protein